MYIIATFEHSKKIEIALADLKNSGLNKRNILALPLDNRSGTFNIIDQKNHSDRESFFDLAAILGMIFMLLGAIYGFVLKWGPIIWALIGLILGLIVGLGIKYLNLKKKHKGEEGKKSQQSEIVLIVNCAEYQVEKVKQILWDNNALGLTTFNNQNDVF